MKNQLQRRIAVGAAAVVTTFAAAVGVSATAPLASAAVNPGKYTFTTTSFGIPSSAPATVRGKVLTVYGPTGPIHYRIHNTPRSGYIDSGQGQRYFLNGRTFFGPVVIGHSTLTPRR